ncbi:NAD-dependent succinate-semialdehyde dehydrogenase [Ruegeria lacuscaerulensis]|uniref:NAD-dependent succinate-semialdehyde dehydrogenase n=1 Tax=Ruegeria lacuscaerulensis TaxID=55218 RepID=UPI00147FD11A|nr:NAD-dependent succinate-semialdehyde dehydrogenase [Ruegeria lacuscaerulensis]
MTVAQSLLDRLDDPTLLCTNAFIGGEHVSKGADGAHFAVHNPANGEVLAELPDLGAEAVNTAVDSAYEAQRAWAATTGTHKSDTLKVWHRLWVENADDLATIMTAEQGKPLAEAKGEVLYGASFLEWYSEEAKRIYGDTIPGHREDTRILVLKEPVGVVGAITPWNFPNAMIARKVAPALATGCAMVAKPAAETPLSTLALAVLAERAGLPMELFSVVTASRGAPIGDAMTSNPRVAKITFTGSTEVGRQLMRQGADQIKKLGLELGGNAPFIVFEDADIDAAVQGALQSKYRNAGQTCVCTNRIYVQSGIVKEFTKALATAVAEMQVGDGFGENVDIGPLINEASVQKVSEHIEDAVVRGGTVETGGETHSAGPLFFKPTVISGATDDMLIAHEETFGPVAPIFTFDNEAEVIERANDSEFGLAGYFFSRDVARVFRVAEGLKTGMIGVNTGLISTAVAPFGGVKQSGIGREGSRYGAEDYLNIKYVCLGGIT